MTRRRAAPLPSCADERPAVLGGRGHAPRRSPYKGLRWLAARRRGGHGASGNCTANPLRIRVLAPGRKGSRGATAPPGSGQRKAAPRGAKAQEGLAFGGLSEASNMRLDRSCLLDLCRNHLPPNGTQKRSSKRIPTRAKDLPIRADGLMDGNPRADPAREAVVGSTWPSAGSPDPGHRARGLQQALLPSQAESFRCLSLAQTVLYEQPKHGNAAPAYGNDVSGHANDVSGHANDVSGHANDVSGHTNDMSGHANDMSGHANAICARMFVTGGGVGRGGWDNRCARSPVTMAGMDTSMGSGTRQEVLAKLRRRYQGAGRPHRKKLIDQAVELLGYHRKSAIRALAAEENHGAACVNTGRPARYNAGLLKPWLRPTWQATPPLRPLAGVIRRACCTSQSAS